MIANASMTLLSFSLNPLPIVSLPLSMPHKYISLETFSLHQPIKVHEQVELSTQGKGQWFLKKKASK